MNREILFRGKRVDNGGWVYGFYYYSTRYGTHNVKISLEDEKSFVEYDAEVIPETVGQFTGLTDNNGTKIFEGDIVKWDDRSNGKYWRIAEVKINPSIVFDCSEIKEFNGIKNSSDHIFRYANFIYKDTHNHLEITGNIHDNPTT